MDDPLGIYNRTTTLGSKQDITQGISQQSESGGAKPQIVLKVGGGAGMENSWQVKYK